MKRYLRLLVIGIVLVLSACVRPASTQQALPSRELIGLSVETKNGELVGNLQSLLLTPANGQIEYGVVQLAPGPLQFGKVPMHAGPNRVLVPWRIITIAQSGSHLEVDCSLDKVRNAPPAPIPLDTEQPGWDAEAIDYWSSPNGAMQ